MVSFPCVSTYFGSAFISRVCLISSAVAPSDSAAPGQKVASRAWDFRPKIMPSIDSRVWVANGSTEASNTIQSMLPVASSM